MSKQSARSADSSAEKQSEASDGSGVRPERATVKEPLKIRSAYDPVPRVSVLFTEPSKTLQSQSAETDINNIVARHTRDGVITHLNPAEPLFGDNTGVADYHSALSAVVAAQQMFEELPSDLREEHGNDPGRFLEWYEDPENLEETIELGLREPVEPAQGSPVPVQVVQVPPEQKPADEAVKPLQEGAEPPQAAEAQLPT